ncbi:MAG: FumA C-terminus/TtdB family hydratase beta subunit [Bacillota bacterium]
MSETASFWQGAVPLRVPFQAGSGSAPELKAGTRVLIGGVVYTARDAAHRRIVEALDKGLPLPFDLKGQVIYYAGPCPPAPGQVIGSLGPTTSGRMDPYAPRLLVAGLGGMIGKGRRNREVLESVKRFGAVYLVTIGGAGALLSRTVKKADLIAYPDLGPEAVYRLEVEDFPAIVGIDAFGNDIYERRNSL